MSTIQKVIRTSCIVAVLPVLLILASGFNAQMKEKKTENITVEQKNKEFIKVYTEDFWNSHNLAALKKYYSDDFILHSVDGDQDLEQYKELCQAYFKAFPDLHITSHDLIAEGDKVAKRWTANCTHKEEFMGIPATGNKIVFTGLEIFRIQEGKITEIWINMDNLGMLKQLGVIPDNDE